MTPSPCLQQRFTNSSTFKFIKFLYTNTCVIIIAWPMNFIVQSFSWLYSYLGGRKRAREFTNLLHKFTNSRIYQISVYKHLYHYRRLTDEFHHAIKGKRVHDITSQIHKFTKFLFTNHFRWLTDEFHHAFSSWHYSYLEGWQK